ncbi:MAG: hypothetical protein AAFO61_14490 [Pseudomonadota bacterium]
MRILAFLLLLSAATTGFAASKVDLARVEKTLDPIVTGQNVSVRHKQKWRAQRAAYLKCPQCVVAEQPFPGEED